MRYMRNEESGEVHDREHGDERCNIDDCLHKRDSDDLEELWKPIAKEHSLLFPSLCKWCFGPHKETAPVEAQRG